VFAEVWLMTLDEFLIDKRIVDRNIKNGKVDRALYQNLLAALPDRSGNLWRRPEASAASVVAAPQPQVEPMPAVSARIEPSAPSPLQPTPLV
jgi:hypothetical protein